MQTDNMNMRRFRFKKPYKTSDGVYKENGEITIVEQFGGPVVYYDSGMVPVSYARELLHIVNTQHLREEYLKEERIISNKI